MNSVRENKGQDSVEKCGIETTQLLVQGVKQTEKGLAWKWTGPLGRGRHGTEWAGSSEQHVQSVSGKHGSSQHGIFQGRHQHQKAESRTEGQVPTGPGTGHRSK